jgi:energy-coupling factor transporter ATP-binding protein EcfA2
MDFYQFRTKETKSGATELYPGFTVGRSADLMVRGGNFYAIWDEKQGLWSTDEYEVARLMDEELRAHAQEVEKTGTKHIIKDMRSFESNSWSIFQKFISQVGDSSHQLDQNLTFANTEVKKNDYVSRRLPYSLLPGDYSAWDELVGTLYSVEERAKIEWAIGAIVSGDAKKIQKFVVLYGPPASGKSTVLNIIEKLFEGYTTTFEAKALGGNNNQFATEVFKNNPIAAIQHDGDLSRIEDNARLNSIISHEYMTMNEKFKSSYTARINAFLFMGTNQPVRISDAKSGIIRRLIDVHPTGVKIPINHYYTLLSRIDFELGAIAHHCLEVYQQMGKNYYNPYRPLEMMLQTDVFFNFIEAYYDIFKEQDGASLTQAYSLYKEYCGESGIERMLPKYKFREELRNYFDEFKDRAEVEGHIVRSYYQGFNANKFKQPSKDAPTFSLVIEETESLLDYEWANMPAQGATKRETPKKKWEEVTTVLGEIDTSELHFVKVPAHHIVIDFDLRGENGEKSLERNLEAASVWPATYAELSKGGAGVHLHYNYEGDVSELRSDYSEGIEVKTLLGDASLRRRLSKCNRIPVATINSGLPFKEKKMLDVKTIQSERGLRDLIARNLRKEIHPGTKPSVDFIKKILDDAYVSEMTYDLTDLRPKILAFAQGSSNQPLLALKVVQQMKFSSEPTQGLEEAMSIGTRDESTQDDRLEFFDIEVYPNLFVICWKYQGDAQVVRMINPKAKDVEPLLNFRLVGFNNRRYDNHILYAAFMGYTNEQLYKLSKKIIDNDYSALFGEAYNISYTDIYDFSSKKQSLKKFQIELGIHHQELDIPWDEPVPEELWDKVADYCVNDVIATEATFEARKQDFIARQILADLSGLTVNDTTQRHTARIIFGNDRNPQAKFVYTDLRKEFPEYVFDMGKSTYRDEAPGEGGYIYAEPGMYENVAVLDIASMHPTTIEQLNLFGEYTPKFAALKAARIAIKRKDYDSARKMLNGKLAPHLEDPAHADALAYALKIVINIVYGLTSAKFDNPFRDVRNKDNIIAKRGALFMIDLKHAVQEKGYQVVHIKTDSIKIPNATEEIIEFITLFGEKYGYDFDNEGVYDRFCLVNESVYIARKDDLWDAVGAQFQHPYVFKTLFSGEPIEFNDLCETKQVTQGAMYLDFEHDKPMAMPPEGMRFVGRTGRFVPVEEGQNGAMLYRIKDDKHYAVTGTKGYLWLEAEMATAQSAKVNIQYFERLSEEAQKTIGKFGDFDKFVN